MDEHGFARRVIRDDVLNIDTGTILDNSNAHVMVAQISTALEEGFKFIILDMHELEFLSSAGVGSILGTVETAREAGGDIIVCNASESILHVFEVLDLSDYLTVKGNLAEAETLCVPES